MEDARAVKDEAISRQQFLIFGNLKLFKAGNPSDAVPRCCSTFISAGQGWVKNPYLKWWVKVYYVWPRLLRLYESQSYHIVLQRWPRRGFGLVQNKQIVSSALPECDSKGLETSLGMFILACFLSLLIRQSWLNRFWKNFHTFTCLCVFFFSHSSLGAANLRSVVGASH